MLDHTTYFPNKFSSTHDKSVDMKITGTEGLYKCANQFLHMDSYSI